MVKHTQTIRLQQPANCLSVFDHFVNLALKGLRLYELVTTNSRSCFHKYISTVSKGFYHFQRTLHKLHLGLCRQIVVLAVPAATNIFLEDFQSMTLNRDL